ncbi:MAG: D-alanine--D-alanine ligase [Clostridia bacterium]|nr:D-alanine--D-alanine ligase [Clostridia bacterium]
MNKLRVCVIFGGQSGEHEVSLSSATAILNAMNYDKYIVYKIGITRTGEWYLFEGENGLVLEDKWLENGKNTPICVDFARKCLISDGKELQIDVAFPALHGDFGEDGRVQALFELLGIPMVGPSTASAATCMDKHLCKSIAMRELVPVAPYVAFSRRDFINGDTECELDGVVFVKPSTAGSSLGITRASGKSEIACAIAEALKYSNEALVEREIRGRECEVAVTEIDGQIVVSEVGEISYKGEFYDYATKYKSSKVKYKIPARIGEECRNLCKKYAKTLFKALGCHGHARFDFFVTKEKEIYFNEVNALPGFTEGSMYPMLMNKLGYDMPRLIDLLIGESVRNF